MKKRKLFIPFIFLLIFPVFLYAAEQLFLPPDAIAFVESLTGEATAQTATATARPLQLRGPLFAHDLVKTGRGARLQLRFKDKTVFVMSQEAEIRLDEFVYSPKTGAGSLKVYVNGVFRFVTGKIVKQNPENMRVNMPVGSIGIRGTRVAGRADEDKSLVMLEPAGEGEEQGYSVTVSNEVNGEVVETEITEPGYGTEFSEDEAPEDPELIDEEVLEELVEDLGGMDENLNANASAEDPFTEDAVAADGSSETSASSQSVETEAGTSESEAAAPASVEPGAVEPESGQPADSGAGNTESEAPATETEAGPQPVDSEASAAESEMGQIAHEEAGAAEAEAGQPPVESDANTAELGADQPSGEDEASPAESEEVQPAQEEESVAEAEAEQSAADEVSVTESEGEQPVDDSTDEDPSAVTDSENEEQSETQDSEDGEDAEDENADDDEGDEEEDEDEDDFHDSFDSDSGDDDW